ncbi:MAG: hypothetical protein QGH39_08635, partial [Candidatus Thermoplasmatota archaeon]|nr:hypothetical protein [Candidatus Thermoplasmatota archaeon]
YCRNRGLELIGVILNNRKVTEKNPDNERIKLSNGKQIRVYGKVQVLGEIPYVKNAKSDQGLVKLIEATTENVNIDYIMEKI